MLTTKLCKLAVDKRTLYCKHLIHLEIHSNKIEREIPCPVTGQCILSFRVPKLVNFR